MLDRKERLAEKPGLPAREAIALQEAQKATLHTSILTPFSQDIEFGAPIAPMSFIEHAIALWSPNFQVWLDNRAGEFASIPTI